jgi:hypothetical protein
MQLPEIAVPPTLIVLFGRHPANHVCRFLSWPSLMMQFARTAGPMRWSDLNGLL